MPTGIDYLDEVWNPITGCEGRGCKVRDRCWAREMVKRFPAIHGIRNNRPDEWTGPIPFSVARFHPDRLEKPLHWKKPRKIGVCFMGDWMDNYVRQVWIDDMLEVINACPQHQFFSLTKRPENLEPKIYGHCKNKPVRELGGGDYLPNLFNGVSVCDQEDADRKIPELLKIPGKKWISIEPCLSHISLRGYDGKIYRPWLDTHAYPKMIDLIVIGAESGPKRRTCKIEWMIDAVKQCKSAGVPVFVKQIQDSKGKVIHDINLFPPELQVRQWPRV